MMKREKLVFNKDKVGRRVTRKDLLESDEMTDSEEVRIPLSNIRKKIAESVMQSLHNAAQLTHHTSADATKLLAFRKQIKSQLSSGIMPDITLNDMVCFAVTKALMNFSGMNGHFLGEEILLFKSVNLGFAVDTERGLMVPVVRKAERRSLDELSIEMNNLAERCKRGDIDPDLIKSESAGFTVSNLGAYGIEMFTPIINLPQMAILGVNAITQRPVETGEGTISMIPYIGLSLTYDHRALDGGPASLFLKEIKEQIENFDGK
jgi:pyruvate dehydrogenase E2 component (dihydrolipoamide acetyltransferase)